MDSERKTEFLKMYMPVMPISEYNNFKERFKSILRQHYRAVTFPVLGPVAAPIDSVDVFVAGPYHPVSSRAERFEALSVALGGVTTFIHALEDIATIAIPWPMASRGSHANTEIDGCSSFLRLDITVCSSDEQISWTAFRHSHGGIANIINSVVHPYGLAIKPDGFWLTIPDFRLDESSNYTTNLGVRLTSEPDRALEFLGLDPEQFSAPSFADLNSLYQYVAMSRLFSATQAQDLTERDDRNQAFPNQLRHRNARCVFQHWHNGFLPACRERNLYNHSPVARETVIREAIYFFDVSNAIVTSYRAQRQSFRQTMDDAISRAAALAGNT
ncbi:hypothetical protein HJFPF1_06891 [Paramyrothecium foliicola]|nr:hypothetical protein HJFPF1_06891 [Paramyrothecium foliicola]